MGCHSVVVLDHDRMRTIIDNPLRFTEALHATVSNLGFDPRNVKVGTLTVARVVRVGHNNHRCFIDVNSGRGLAIGCDPHLQITDLDEFIRDLNVELAAYDLEVVKKVSDSRD